MIVLEKEIVVALSVTGFVKLTAPLRAAELGAVELKLPPKLIVVPV